MPAAATTTRRRGFVVPGKPVRAAAPAGPYRLNGKAADVWEFVRDGKVVAVMEKLSSSLITTADAANREQAAAMLAELNRAAAPAAPPPATAGPGVAALVRCLTDLRANLHAWAATGKSVPLYAARDYVSTIDDALSSSPEAEVARAIGPAHVTPRQGEVIAAVLAYRRAHGGGNPTLAEVGEAMGTSKTTVTEHAHALQKKGVLRIDRGMARSIHFVHIDARK